MTHALHRKMGERNDDYVIQVRSSPGFNRNGSGPQLINLLEEFMKLDPVAFGNPTDGCTLRDRPDEIIKKISDNSNIHVVFKSEVAARKAVKIAKEMNTGLSVTIAGPLDRIRDLAMDQGLKIDSVQIGLGTFGTAPMDEIQASLVTLCGHMRVSPNLIRHMAEKIKNGEIDAETAADEIGKVCRCGCFNTAAAGHLLRRWANANGTQP